MKNRASIFIAKYIISQYDGEVDTHPFSNIEKAIEYCEKSGEAFVEDSLNDCYGWLIEEHTVDYPKGKIKYYNSKGTELFVKNTPKYTV